MGVIELENWKRGRFLLDLEDAPPFQQSKIRIFGKTHCSKLNFSLKSLGWDCPLDIKTQRLFWDWKLDEKSETIEIDWTA